MRAKAISAACVLLATMAAAPPPAVAAATAAKQPIRVVASFYPLAWAVEQVGGQHVRVTDLTPPGAEPHDLELTTGDRAAIETAALVILMGGGFQPSVEEAVAQRGDAALRVLSKLAAGSRTRTDPHVWLDPVLMQQVVRLVGRAIGRRAGFDDTAAVRRVTDRLGELDAQYRQGLASCDRTLIVTSHEAFGWLARRYGLRQVGIAGIDPENEPDPDRLAHLAELVKRKHVTTIFTEDLVSPKVANTLAREAGGVKTEVLSP